MQIVKDLFKNTGPYGRNTQMSIVDRCKDLDKALLRNDKHKNKYGKCCFDLLEKTVNICEMSDSTVQESARLEIANGMQPMCWSDILPWMLRYEQVLSSSDSNGANFSVNRSMVPYGQSKNPPYSQNKKMCCFNCGSSDIHSYSNNNRDKCSAVKATCPLCSRIGHFK